MHIPEDDNKERSRPSINITQTANNSENVNQQGYVDGDVTINQGGTHTHHTGDNINVGNVSDTVMNIGSGTLNAQNIAGGDITIGAPPQADPEVQKMFADLSAKIAALQDEVDREDAQEFAQQFSDEMAKGESADEKALEGSLKRMGRISDDIIDVIEATITSPTAGIAEVVKKVWARFKASRQGA